MAKRAKTADILREETLWRGLGARWRQLFGNFAAMGVSFEWHELPAGGDVAWDPSFHPESLELCLNFEGDAEVRAGSESLLFGPWTAGFYRQGAPPLKAVRRAGAAHRFITVEWSPEFLARHLSGVAQHLHPIVQSVLDGRRGSRAGAPMRLDLRQRALVASLSEPPVLAAAQGLWFQAKAVELVGEFLFQPAEAGELFCRRQQRVARDRADRVAELLRADLVHPPGLDALGRAAGCSPFYLSRTFSKEMGMTVPQFLRQLRLERAAELLRAGSHNVTEAALAVGYNSLSHFSQAFHQHHGCCPGLFPMATTTQQAIRPDRGDRRG